MFKHINIFFICIVKLTLLSNITDNESVQLCEYKLVMHDSCNI